MAFAIVGVAKQKGGSVGSSGHHNDRTRETPNADPERGCQNRVLIGDDKNVREAVDRIIDEHGGKPRRDSVEAVEYVLTASPEWFDERDPEKYREKVDRFVEQAVKFLEDPRSRGKVAKAVLHMDERTPHVQAHKAPIDPDGKLNAKHYFGGREKMCAVHDLYAEYMSPLGLERGRRGSRATHRRVKEFYASINQEVTFELEYGDVPLPPKVMVTQQAREQYARRVADSLLRQLLERFKVISDQAQLTRDEHNHRVEAERRAEEVGRQAAERIEEAERAAQVKIAEVERGAAERFENLRKSALQIYEENKELHGDKKRLLDERNDLQRQVLVAQHEKFEALRLARERGDRLSDIPLTEVMTALDYHGERRGEAVLYRARDGRVSMTVTDGEARNFEGRVVCRNSVDLVLFMENINKGGDVSLDEALSWLAENFGEGRAAAAYVARSEQSVAGFMEERRLGRERQAPGREPALGPREPDHEPPGYSPGR